MRLQKAFTLIELVVVIALLGILGATALGRYADIARDADAANIDMIFATTQSYLNTVNIRYTLLGSPANPDWVDLDGLDIRFRNGLVRQVRNSNHVPPGTPNRNNQATRFWFMIFSDPPPVINRADNTSTGWAMYNGNGDCGAPRSRCWRYRNAGTDVAQITYEFNAGTTTLTIY